MATYMCIIFRYALPLALAPVKVEIFSTFIVLIFLVTFILPAVNLFIFKVFGLISSFKIPDRAERQLPFVFISVIYFLMTYLFYSNFKIGLSQNILRFLLIMDFLVAASTITTFFYKVSVHALAVCGMVGILIPLNSMSDNRALLYPTVGMIVIAGLVMSSRLALQEHSIREITLGAVMGFSIGFLSMMIFF